MNGESSKVCVCVCVRERERGAGSFPGWKLEMESYT